MRDEVRHASSRQLFAEAGEADGEDCERAQDETAVVGEQIGESGSSQHDAP